jgi:hypothetical protein
MTQTKLTLDLLCFKTKTSIMKQYNCVHVLTTCLLLLIASSNNVVCGGFATVRLQPSLLISKTTSTATRNNNNNNNMILPSYYYHDTQNTNTIQSLLLHRGGAKQVTTKPTTTTNTQLLLSSTFNTGTKCPMTGTATILASLWGTGGVIYILLKAIKRVLPIALEPFQKSGIPLTQFQLMYVTKMYNIYRTNGFFW